MLLIRHNDLSAAANWAIVGWASIAALAGFVGPVLRWSRTAVEVDAAGARCTTGIFWRSTVDVPHEAAREMAVEQGYLGRQLGYGRLRIVDASGSTYVLPPVGNVAAWRAVLSRRERRPTGRRGQ
jgi:membrane protein YdbS with pleckstrin-like domain